MNKWPSGLPRMRWPRSISDFFGLLDWTVVPERAKNRAWPGPQPHPRTAYVKALLVKLREGKPYISDLRRFLIRQPVLVLLLEVIQWKLIPRLAFIALLNLVNWLPLIGVAIMLALLWLRWVVLTVLVVLVSIVWTEALLVVSGLRLSMVSSMLNSLITIIGVATSMHVLLFFREQHRTHSPEEALGHSILQLAKPVWWSIATTY